MSTSEHTLVELKAKVADLGIIRTKINQLEVQSVGVFHQKDVYYEVPEGRLKFREVEGSNVAELIYYEREDIAGPKRSVVTILRIPKNGDFRKILEETRWELDIRGYKRIKLVVSGGITEKDIIELNDIVDAFGVGTAISAAPVLDFALDIVEIDGKPLAKRGKRSGAKKVIRCNGCADDRVVPEAEKINEIYCGTCGKKYEEVFVDAISNGRVLYGYPPAGDIRKKVTESFKFLEL